MPALGGCDDVVLVTGREIDVAQVKEADVPESVRG
jgi:hypothetical protein